MKTYTTLSDNRKISAERVADRMFRVRRKLFYYEYAYTRTWKKICGSAYRAGVNYYLNEKALTDKVLALYGRIRDCDDFAIYAVAIDTLSNGLTLKDFFDGFRK